MAFFATQPPQQLPEPGYGQGLEWREAGKWYRVNLIGTRVGPTPYGVGAEPTNSLPGSGTGNVGDFYMHTPQGGYAHLYGPKQANGTWPLIGRVNGSPEVGPNVGIPVGYSDGGLYTNEPTRPTSTNPTYPYTTQIASDGVGSFWGLVLWQYNTVEGWYATNPVQTGASPAEAVVAEAQAGQALVWDGTQWVNALIDSADTTYDNSTSGLTATDVQAAIDEVVLGLDAQNEASEISYDNATSGLAATDVQAAVDEVVGAKLDVPSFIEWERLSWETLIWAANAPTPADGGPGWFFFDSAGEDLYGPATFNPALLPTGVWDWGSALSNVVFSATAPTNESGDWYVWDENGDGSSYVLFSKRSSVQPDDLLFWNDGAQVWEARSQKISADNVYSDMTNIDTSYGVDSVQTQLNNLFSNSAQTYSGGNHLFMDLNIDTAHEVNPFDGNIHVLTLVNDTTISFSTAWNTTSQLGPRAAELTIVLKQDSTGGWVTTWDTNVKVSTGTTLTTTADAVDMLKAVSWDDGATWYVTQIGADFA